MPKLKFLLTILLTVSSKLAISQNNASLASADGKVFRVISEGKPVNPTMQAQVLLENITKDTLHVQLEFENKKKLPATLYFLEQGAPCAKKEFSYKVEFNDVSLKVTFLGTYDIVPLPDPLVPARPVKDTSLNFNNRLFDGFCEIKEGRPAYFNNLPKESGCLSAMPQEFMGYTALLVSKAEIQEQKFSIVENVCRNNCMSVAQLSALLNYIDFEIEKLKIVRVAYVHLVDPSNKKNLEKNFRFDASINELNSFMNNPGLIKQNRTMCTKAASEMVISSYVQRLSNSSNDSERLEVLKKSYSELCYSTQQAALILNKFIHDREKLDAAKLIYLNCVEKEAFMLVAETFSYKQTANELQEFIDKQAR